MMLRGLTVNGKKAKELRKAASLMHNMNPTLKEKVLYKLMKGRKQKRDVIA